MLRCCISSQSSESNAPLVQKIHQQRKRKRESGSSRNKKRRANTETESEDLDISHLREDSVMSTTRVALTSEDDIGVGDIHNREEVVSALTAPQQ